MAISLRKGGNISLKKAASDSGSTAPLTKVTINLNWEERVTDGASFDVDASVFLLNNGGKVRGTQDFIFYNQTHHESGSVIHHGDDTTGSEGESVDVEMGKIPSEIERISFVVTIHEADDKGQNFGMISDAYIKVSNSADGKEIARYDLSEDASTETAMVFAELYNRNGEWKFKAVGQGYAGGLGALCKSYGVDI
jgi:tellurium resistance protein TerD